MPSTHCANWPLTQSIAPAVQEREEVLEDVLMEDVSIPAVEVDVAEIVTAMVTAETSIA